MLILVTMFVVLPVHPNPQVSAVDDGGELGKLVKLAVHLDCVQ